jgi:hypothetical protein
MFTKRMAKLVIAGGAVAAGLSAGLSPILAVGIWAW